MKNPCLSCDLLDAKKDNPTCRDCERRVEYVRSLGGRSPVLPDTYLDARRFAPIEERPASDDPAFVAEMTRKADKFFAAALSDAAPAEVETRVCRYCKEEKPLSDFPKHSGYKSGIETKCKDCKLALRAGALKPMVRRRPTKKELEKKYVGKEKHVKEDVKKCSKCGETLPLDKFYKSANTIDGRENTCIACRRVRSAEVRQQRRQIVHEILERCGVKTGLPGAKAIVVDFRECEDLLAYLEERAASNFRTPGNEILAILKRRMVVSAVPAVSL